MTPESNLIKRSGYISISLTIMSVVFLFGMPIASVLASIFGIISGIVSFSELKFKWGIVTSIICAIVFMYILIAFLINILSKF